jgi:outer membrane lipoprotein LolB
LALLLTGCAELPVLLGSDNNADQEDLEIRRAWQGHQNRITKIKEWTLTGKVGIQTEQESWNAGIRWRQTGNDYEIRLIAPFGQGTYELQGNDTVFSMRTPDNQIIQADSPETLMQKTLQWSAPVRDLVYWVRGIPAPDKSLSGLRLDAQSLLLDMQQSDWRISVLRYLQSTAGQLPGKLFIQNEHYKIRLVISKWDIE